MTITEEEVKLKKELALGTNMRLVIEQKRLLVRKYSLVQSIKLTIQCTICFIYFLYFKEPYLLIKYHLV